MGPGDQSCGLWLREIGCVRGERLLFEELSLALGPGDAAQVTGPNGAGKSSLLRIAAGLLGPSAGTVERAGGCAYLGERVPLDPDLALGRALAFWNGEGGEAMARLGLAPLTDIPVRLLSTGQRRRAGLAMVLAARAPLWLLDEPANGLDAAAAALLAELIAEHRSGGGVVVVATHQPIALPGAAMIALGAAA